MISIIIPLYNRESSIGYCLDRLRSQTYKNYEVIIVDDGSTDKSKQICSLYTIEDSRFRYFYKVNEGVSAARNYGIKLAQGEYVTFVDSDDILLPDALKNMAIAAEKGFDLVVGGYRNARLTSTNPFRFKETSIVSFNPVTVEGSDEIYSYFFKQFDHNKGNFFYCFSKLYRKNLLTDITFPIGITLGEDRIFFLDYISRVHNICFIPSNDYVVMNIATIGEVQASAKKRPAEEIFRCLSANYEKLKGINSISNASAIKSYADDFFISKWIEYAFLLTPGCREEVIFINKKSVLPFFRKYSMELKNVKNTTFRLLAILLFTMGPRSVFSMIKIRSLLKRFTIMGLWRNE